MSKFKVGDRVRYIGKEKSYSSIKTGEVYTIKSVRASGISLEEEYVDGGDENLWYNYALDNCFELVEAAEKSTEIKLHKNYTLVIRDIKINLTEEELQDLKKELNNE